jgi:hypothetical protein
MHKDVRALWRSATTLADLGEVTAAYLEGTVPDQPGWMPGGPAEETGPLIPTLAALCRAGFVTTGSQPGFPTRRGYDDAWWEQRAAVEGFADDLTLEWLRAALAGTRFQLVVWTTPTHHLVGSWDRAGLSDLNDGVVVTRRNGVPTCSFGRQLTRRELSGQAGGNLSRKAISAMCAAYGVLVFDPLWLGENDLWPILRRAARPRGRRTGDPVRRRPVRVAA